MPRSMSVEKKQVLATGFQDAFLQSRFINRQVVGIPAVDAFPGNVDHGDFVIGTEIGDHGHSGSADIPGADTQNIFHILLVAHWEFQKNTKKGRTLLGPSSLYMLRLNEIKAYFL